MEYTPPGPVARAFMKSDAFIRGIRGPIGSGKTTCAIMDMWRTACMQHQSPEDGIRRYRGVLTRNTYGELESTTLRSFLDWFPAHIGKLVYGAPITFDIKSKLPDGSELEAEFMFLALDRPEHIRKLLSLEVTQGYMNEAREQPKPILDALSGRIRYPSMRHGGPVRGGIIMDTNSPDTEHWWPKISDMADPEIMDKMHDLEKELRDMGDLAPGQPLMEFFSQPPAEDAQGRLNRNAENIQNLPPGYYLKMKVGKSDEWVKVYVRNEYGFIMDGVAVYPEYRDNLHCREVKYDPRLKVHIGMDFGLTPAAVFGQRSPMGQMRWLSELVATRLGAKSFAKEVRAHMAENYPEAYANPDKLLGSVTGDPAGQAGMADDAEKTVFTVMDTEGLKAKPASTNDFTIRREAVATPLTQLIDGEPALVIATRCKMLRKAMAGGYHFRKLKVAGDRWEQKPNKNMHSHVAEAGQYLNLGVGLGKEALQRPDQLRTSGKSRPTHANIDYNMHG